MLVCLGMIPIRNMTGITAHHHLCTEVMSASTRNLCRPRAFTEVLQLQSLSRSSFLPWRASVTLYTNVGQNQSLMGTTKSNVNYFNSAFLESDAPPWFLPLYKNRAYSPESLRGKKSTFMC